MVWLAIRLQAEIDAADSFTDALLAAGALSVTVEDAAAGTPDEAAQYAEPGLASTHAWPHNTLTALVEADADPAAIVSAAARACGLAAPAFSLDPVEDRDWVRSTQSQFEPMRVADSLWIVPSWRDPPERDAINITIDPGLAFGTGSHATTRLVLRWLKHTLKAGETLLDYGCGSGILAIVAARLGAREVVGVDIDPQAIRAARDNAAKNRVAVRFISPEAIPDRPADIVVANILANPLVVLAPLIGSLCKHRLALSGVLDSQAEQVLLAYAPLFALEVAEEEEGWILLTGERR